MPLTGHSAAIQVETPRARPLRRRRRNRRVAIQRYNPLLGLANGFARAGRAGLCIVRVVSKPLLLAVVIAACLVGGRWAVAHVLDSPRFSVEAIDVTATPHLAREDVVRLSGVSIGDRLLRVDTDQVAARITKDPWVASVRVSRRLPSTLVIEVQEKHAPAVAALSGLYLVDEKGHPFKRATMAEADGLPVLTGIARARYLDMPQVSEAAFREALGVLRAYASKPGRPRVGEVNIDPGFGFSLFLFDGGAEIRLGRGKIGEKLAQLDRILEAVATKEVGGLSALEIVHLDLPGSGRVPVLLHPWTDPPSPAPPTTHLSIARN